MFDSEPLGEGAPRSGPEARGRTALDGLVIDRSEVWVVVGRHDDDPVDLLWADDADAFEPATSMKLCRAVRAGTIVLGEVDPDRDALLSQILRGEARGTA